MKVGVLTYHSANNYGTCLQCYALMHLVEQAGYDCDVIDYRGEKLSNSPVMRKGLAAQVTDFCVRTGSRQLKRMSEFLPSKAFSSQPACDGKRFTGARQAV